MSETQYIRTRTKSGKEEMIALPTGGVAAHNQAWSTITDTPSTLAGYGITDGSSIPYPGAGIALSSGSAWESSIPNNSANWNTAYTDRLKWDGGATGLTPATGRTSLGGTTVGQAIFTLSNPSAISFLRMNADNSVSALSASDFKTALSLQNVTNESKSTMFTNPDFTGIATFQSNYFKAAWGSPIYGFGMVANPDVGSWSRGWRFYKQSDDSLLGGFGGYGAQNTLTSLWLGKDYNDFGIGIDLDGAVDLRYDNASKLVTASNGVHLLDDLTLRYGRNMVHYDVSEAHYWLQVPHSTNEYYWSYDGTMQMKLTSDGTLYCKGDVIAAYTP